MGARHDGIANLGEVGANGDVSGGGDEDLDLLTAATREDGDEEPLADTEAPTADPEAGEEEGEAPAADPEPEAEAPLPPSVAKRMAELEGRLKTQDDEIRALMKSGLTRKQAEAEADGSREAAGAPDPWAEPDAYDAFWKDVADTKKGPGVFRGAIHRELEGAPAVAALRKEIADLKKWREERDGHIDEVRGNIMLQRWQEKNPSAKKHMPRVLSLVSDYGIKSFDKALEIAQAEADAKLYRAQQQAANGGRPAGGGKAPIAVRKPPPPAAAAPRSSRAPGGVGAGTKGTKVNDGRTGTTMRSAMADAYAEVARK